MKLRDQHARAARNAMAAAEDALRGVEPVADVLADPLAVLRELVTHMADHADPPGRVREARVVISKKLVNGWEVFVGPEDEHKLELLWIADDYARPHVVLAVLPTGVVHAEAPGYPDSPDYVAAWHRAGFGTALAMVRDLHALGRSP